MRQIEGKSVYSVSEVNSLARQTLENMSFWVEGEISSFKGLNSHYRYVYFDLKDPQTGYKLPCILEPEIYLSTSLDLKDGQKILALGNLTLWEKDGRYQMYLHKIEEFGEGLLLAKLEALKKKLQAQGYFDISRKKSLPSSPTNVAVITSKISDAWQDFKKHSIGRYGNLSVTLFDVPVQGENSAPQIIKALKRADKMNFDVIVLARGGGSLEDLASFNEEKLADAIFAAKTCIIVGVGHEKDVTIAQLVADIAASTPTDVAKIITGGFVHLEERLNQLIFRAKAQGKRTLEANFQTIDLIFHQLATNRERLKQIPPHLQFLGTTLAMSQERFLEGNRKRLEVSLVSLANSWRLLFAKRNHGLKVISEKLTILSPQNTLERGYSIASDERGYVIKSAESIDIGSKIRVKFAKGAARSKVFEKEVE